MLNNVNEIVIMKNDKGIALILTLFSLLFISLLIVAFLDTITIDQQIATNQIKDMQASFFADAGIEYAIYKLKNDNSYDTDSNENGDVYPNDDDYDTDNLGAGSYKVGIPTGTLPKTIISTGTMGTFNRSLEVIIYGSGSSVRIESWNELEEGV